MQAPDSTIETLLSTCGSILKEPFWIGHSFSQLAAFTLLLINFSDLLQRISKSDARVSFDDETAPCKDITELMLRMRNAACHSSSEKELDPRTTITFGIMHPHTSQTFGGMGVMGNPHSDDLAFYIGKYRVYLNRHLVRAYNEAIDALISVGYDKSIRWLKIDPMLGSRMSA